jgi:hypothetical protein
VSRVGDSPWVCPSCGNHLGGYKRGSKGSVVIEAGSLRYHRDNGGPVDGISAVHRRMDVVECRDCGVIFAVDESTVPDA